MIGIAADELTAAQDRMLLLGRKSACEKMASFLLELARRAGIDPGAGQPLRVPMKRDDVADYLGVTVETVSRTLGRLRREGLISIAGDHAIALVRPDLLNRLAAGG